MSQGNNREFTLKFNKRTADWFVLTQTAIKTDDGYETRVIEYSAYDHCLTVIENLQKNLNMQLEKIKLLEKSHRNLCEALLEINKEELNSQRPGGGYTRSARISFNALKDEGYNE